MVHFTLITFFYIGIYKWVFLIHQIIQHKKNRQRIVLPIFCTHLMPIIQLFEIFVDLHFGRQLLTPRYFRI